MDLADVKMLWNMCRFERLKIPWCQDLPPWCYVFSMEDLRLWQFSEDLFKYYTYGPAHKITMQMTQPLFADIFASFDNFINKRQNFKTTILNFGHSYTFQPLLAALGLFIDDHDLLASDWTGDHQDYAWKTTNISPYAANIELVLYQCPAEDYKVLMLHNEHIVTEQPACGDTFCSLQQFQEAYKHIEQLDFDKVCEN